ncbi:unnamed protein product [Schistosoma turkestanicum]|nr:unnamed protein product [Schistosoma turkestanicum]
MSTTNSSRSQHTVHYCPNVCKSSPSLCSSSSSSSSTSSTCSSSSIENSLNKIQLNQSNEFQRPPPPPAPQSQQQQQKLDHSFLSKPTVSSSLASSSLVTTTTTTPSAMKSSQSLSCSPFTSSVLMNTMSKLTKEDITTVDCQLFSDNFLKRKYDEMHRFDCCQEDKDLNSLKLCCSPIKKQCFQKTISMNEFKQTNESCKFTDHKHLNNHSHSNNNHNQYPNSDEISNQFMHKTEQTYHKHDEFNVSIGDQCSTSSSVNASYSNVNEVINASTTSSSSPSSQSSTTNSFSLIHSSKRSFSISCLLE